MRTCGLCRFPAVESLPFLKNGIYWEHSFTKEVNQ